MVERSTQVGSSISIPSSCPRVGSKPTGTRPLVALVRSSAVSTYRGLGCRSNSAIFLVSGSYLRYFPSAIRLKTPTRITFLSTSSPPGTTTLALNLTTLPDSVISRCSSNQRRSISSSDASWVLEPIFSASLVKNLVRSGNWMSVRELSNLARASPAAC